jgi:phosphatidyl-myo-inositol dimannoside synthase
MRCLRGSSTDLRRGTKGHVKSLLVSNMYFPPQAGGISRFMGSVASSLGPDHVCCLTSVPSNPGSRKDNLGIRVYRKPAAFSQTTSVQAISLALAISQIMLIERPQIIQLAMAYEGFIGLWLRRWFRLPFVVYAYGNEILDAMQSEWQSPRLALLRADRVLACSQFTLDLVRKAGVDPERAMIVHPGCDVHRFQPLRPHETFREKILGRRSKDRVILTVGLESLKGHDMVIRALPLLLQTVPDVTYVIVGAGPQAGLDHLACELGVRDHVIFTGLVPDEDLPAIYALCDVFAMPSRQNLVEHSVEGFGLVFLEANACGKPVIGGRSGGISDAVVDGVTGFLVNPQNPQEIANVLKILLTNRELARRLGDQGRSRVLNEFTWDTVCKRIQAILDSIVEDRSAPIMKES